MPDGNAMKGSKHSAPAKKKKSSLLNAYREGGKRLKKVTYY